MSDLPTIRKQLGIKAGAVKRLTKEHRLYIDEAAQQKIKLDKFIAEGAEGWDVNNGTKMLQEAEKMITDTAERLAKSVDGLRDLVVAAKKEPGLEGEESLIKAEEALEAASL